MSARCVKCGAAVEEPPRCRNGHAQPLDTLARLAALVGENVDYDLLADKVMERLRAFVPDLVAQVPPEPRLVDAATLAGIVGKKPEWVRRHKHELGGVPLGTGPRPRWGFDPDLAMAKLAHERGVDVERPLESPPPRPLPGKVPLLPIKDKAA